MFHTSVLQNSFLKIKSLKNTCLYLLSECYKFWNQCPNYLQIEILLFLTQEIEFSHLCIHVIKHNLVNFFAAEPFKYPNKDYIFKNLILN